MKILFELSGEHPSLPAAEVRACMSAYGIDFDGFEKKGILVLDAGVDEDKIRMIANRLALSHSVNCILACGNLADIEEKVAGLDFGEGKTFGIRAKKFGGETSTSLLKKRIGRAIERSKHISVNLEDPDIKISIFADGDIYLCREMASVDRKIFERRKPHYRPFSSPISLHPRIAAALVNLARVVAGESLLDPFCGTGGILIEAGLMGAKVVGVDIKDNIVSGCRRNLEHCGIDDAILYSGDSTEMDMGPVDAIVTDLPYGRSTYTGGDIEVLYEKSFDRMRKWLKDGKRAVVGLPEKRFADVGSRYLHLEEIHTMRVHRSLTRYFCVYRKI